MERIIENLSREELFRMAGPSNPNNSSLNNPAGISTTGKIVIAVIIAGILVYVFHDQINDFIQRLSGYPNRE